ncbi:MAG: hypothetical protein DRP87_03255 [Spirochaetes bacterium]|nr:MAG: hypothetical protein DRP87_03255 [Spirochaetota bacterium]
MVTVTGNTEQVIAIDIGTTGVKTALIDRNGNILARNHVKYPTYHKEKQIEQDPDDWWKACVQSFQSLSEKVARNRLAGIILTGQMQDLIPVSYDAKTNQREHISNAILYSDTRATEETVEIRRLLGEEKLAELTGNIIDETSIPAKLLWLKKNKKEVYSSAQYILLGAHDYISWKLTGKPRCDYTNASTTSLLSIQNNTWAEEILSALGLKTDLLPELVPSQQCDGNLAPDMAELLNLPAGTPVFHGCGDVGSNTVGANAGESGSFSCYLGTSGWIAATTGSVMVNPRTGIFNLRHPDPSKIIQVGPMLTAGGNVDWAINVCFENRSIRDVYKEFNTEASKASPGCRGLVYLPYLAGERSPFKDPEALGCFVGLDTSTRRSDLFRAVLEGVAFGMRSIIEVISKSTGDVPGILTVSGGGARLPVWCQILSDVFECTVQIQENAETAGLLGLVVILGKELGWYSDYSLPPGFLRIKDRYFPEDEKSKTYRALYSVFRDLYPSLKPAFKRLRNIQKTV